MLRTDYDFKGAVETIVESKVDKIYLKNLINKKYIREIINRSYVEKIINRNYIKNIIDNSYIESVVETCGVGEGYLERGYLLGAVIDC